MAAAARAGNGQREDMDGRGWGLEVCVSLRMVNPEGKDEFKGRREFEDMLRRGTALTSVSSPAASSPTANMTPRAGQSEPIRRGPPSAPPPRVNASATGSLPPSSSSTRPSPINGPQPLPLHHRPSSASSRMSAQSPLASSSMQLSSSSSAVNSYSTAPNRSTPRANPNPLPPSSSSHAPSSSNRPSSREITPPPPPRRKSPPPTTPSREKLAALLRADDKMSPRMIKQLANHPVLLQLLKGAGGMNTANNAKSPESGDAPTPTPIASSSAGPPTTTATTTEGCCNCGAMESELWRTKNMKDGTKKKVCNGTCFLTSRLAFTASRREMCA